MDKTAKLDYQKDVEKYLETKRVYELFEDLLKELAISKPQNPLDFLIERLSTPEHKMIFIVGPPGSNVRELSLQLADHFKFACVSVGDLLRKEVAKRTEHGMEIESAIKSGRYVNDSLVIELVHKQIAAMQKEKKNCIVEGFPKTVVQGLAMQKAGIIPTTFITLNMSDPKINECVERKFSSPESQTAFLPDRVKHTMAQNYSLEYKLNINGIKKIYNHQYFQVDAEATKEEILEEMARYTRYRLKSKAPRRAARILVVGPPGAGRTTLARALCKRYGFTLVSTPELIHDQVAKKTEIGRMALPLMTRGDLLPDEVIGGLLSERISQSDCLIHGMVIDGFPKVPDHLKLMEELSINPTLIVVLELDNGESSRRMGTHDQEAVQNRQNRWKEMLKALETKYSSLILKINAQKNPKNVLEDASYALENQFA